MPMPMEYQYASEEFERFLRDAIDASGLTTRNQVYTMTQGVLRVFRRRLDVGDALRFANVLPPVLRAIFVADWDLNEPARPFERRELMTAEVKSLRGDHNFSPDTAIRDVATALRKNVNEAELDRVLAMLPNEAVEFWRV
ncbi:DUF2267 domain-containing protein [Methylocystis bryophila]|uniref:DUF2267 domain-containing protein n=1 Tax=Methylocystis bryophila TaxID=655015 RepID=A0A1W6MS04_9HYPH|nr:DUF2267 domain-containing protein [Methylocystis bryophila]ARN80388.1 hypothetical protein B1812_04045 [Methylocystis bryophila]BDV40385.1 hypothetical protein DSM21852_36380 [Methylocystis bryophila]